MKPFIRYVLYLPVALAADALAFILAPLIALRYFVTDVPPKGQALNSDHEYEFLVYPLSLLTTHDAPVNQYAYGTKGYTHWLLLRFNREKHGSNPEWLRYLNRVLWIWRNPAYGVKHHLLGFDSQGVVPTSYGSPHKSVWTLENIDGDTAFLYERYFKYLQVQFGWKLYRDDVDNKRMFAFRIKPRRSPYE